MTDEEIIKAMEICLSPGIPCDDCPLVEQPDCDEISRQYFYERFKCLKTENAALRERLEKAVELPFDHEYADFHIEPYFGEIKPSLVDNGAKVVIPMYVYFKFNSVEEAKTWLSKQQTGGEQ